MLTRHNHIAVQWYKKRHMARMDGTVFNVAKPSLKQANKPQTWTERYELTKEQALPVMKKAGQNAKEGVSYLGTNIKAGGVAAGAVLAAKTSSWKETIAKKEVGNKFKALFTKKKPENAEGEKKEVAEIGVEAGSDLHGPAEVKAEAKGVEEATV